MNKDTLVWIVDDEKELANSYSEFLNPNCKTRVFFSAKEALACFDSEGEKPSVIISDIKMPEMNGLEFVDQIQHRNQDISTILISGHSERNDLVKATQMGVQGYLDKPFDPNVLEKMIEKIADQRDLKSARIHLLSEQISASNELLRSYIHRYTEAENALFENNVPYPTTDRQKKLYVESISKQSKLHAKIERIENDLAKLGLRN